MPVNYQGKKIYAPWISTIHLFLYIFYPFIQKVFIKGAKPVNDTFRRKFYNPVCHCLHERVVMTCKQNNSFIVSTLFVKTLDTFKVKVVGGLIQ